MKNFFLIFMMMLTIASFGQTATWTGTKTINQTNFRLAGITQSNADTKILSIDSLGKWHWVDKATIGSSVVPTLQQITQNGNSTTLPITASSFRLPFYAGFDGNSLTFSSENTPNPPYFYSNQISLGNGNSVTSYDVNNTSLKMPQTIFGTPQYLVTSVNNNNADINGNVTIPINVGAGSTLITSQIVNPSIFIQVFNDNASAVSAGLATGRVYRTSTGDLKVVF
jgi:hypothetical protein